MTSQVQGHLAMLLFSALVAGSFSLGSLAANEIAPMAITAARFVIAAVLIGAVVFATGGASAGALRALWRYPVMGVLMALYFVLMFEGLKTAQPVSMAAVFCASFSRVAMVARRRVMVSRLSVRAPAGAGAGAGGIGAAAGAGGGAALASASRYFTTSALVSRPSLPVP